VANPTRDQTHVYSTELRWSGSTAAGWAAYDREHRVSAAGVAGETRMSADPSFHGDPSLLNPETLLVMSASSCQMLSFLAEAARGRLDVVSYVDSAVGEMAHQPSEPMWVQRIVLRPVIVIRGDYVESEVHRRVESAHRQCFIANSLRTEVTVEATIRSDPGG
jgi:organic hydroperoxide reductase OsmC/OhrA